MGDSAKTASAEPDREPDRGVQDLFIRRHDVDSSPLHVQAMIPFVYPLPLTPRDQQLSVSFADYVEARKPIAHII